MDALSPLVDPYLAQAPDAPADEIADKILAGLDPEDITPILRRVLIDYWTALRPIPVPASAARVAPRPQLAATPAPTATFTRPIPGPSYRDRAAAAWRDRLDQQVTVNGYAKRLGDCTLFDVRLLASAARTEAEAMIRAATVYGRLADAMAVVKANRLRDLPETTLRPLLTGAQPGQ